MPVLVCGWFSFLEGEATAGDLRSRDVVCRWLGGAGIAYDVAESPVLGGGIDLEAADPAAYSHVVFVCGPLAGPQVEHLAERFGGCTLVAVNVSLVGSPVEAAFDEIVARDSAGAPVTPRADLALLSPPERRRVPVVGVVRAPGQPEYQGGGHDRAHAVIDRLLETRLVAATEIDTRIDPRLPRQRRPEQVEALMRSTDAVITTRLHGLVLAIVQGVPAVAIDPVPGGAKVSAQARALGWPSVLGADELDTASLDAALDWCLTSQAREQARRSHHLGTAAAAHVRHQLLGALSRSASTSGVSGR